jgi:lipopolysaccharide export system permease protein
MRIFQAYLFRQILGPTLAILGILSAIALLTQGLSQLDLIIEERSSAMTYLWVTLLATPQLIAIILPLAVFFGTMSALNRLQTESELVVAQTSGMSPWTVVSPLLRLATYAALTHLTINLFVQPAAYREMRETLFEARGNLTGALLREGIFTNPAPGLTFYAREVRQGGDLRALLIDDVRNPSERVTYTARTGLLASVDGAPAIVMSDGTVQRIDQSGQMQFGDFRRYVFDLGPFLSRERDLVLKPSDRFLPELLYPDMTNYYDSRNSDKLLAEGHHRLASPLVNFALVLIAAIAVLGGDFSRRGFARRILIGVAAGLVVRLATLTLQQTAADDPSLNWVQYAAPVGAASVAFCWLMLGRKRRSRQRGASGLPDPPTLLRSPG